MTREEAINDLKDFIDTYLTCHGEEDTIAVSLDNVDVEAFDMAIKALQEPRKGYLSIDDVMEVFDDFMCGEVDEDGIDTFVEMLRDKADMREVEE